CAIPAPIMAAAMTNATTAQTNLTLHTIPTGGSGATEESTFQTIRGRLKVRGMGRSPVGPCAVRSAVRRVSILTGRARPPG
uniref:hypothetical protein n=1 Tax=uncultured Microbacterium sp. TaxID=191216 RepID=UPI0025D69F74